MSQRTTPRSGGMTPNQTRPPLKSTSYVPPHRRGGGCYDAYGRGFSESRTQYGFQPSYGGIGSYGDTGINFGDIRVEASGRDVPAPARTFQEFDFGECLNNNMDDSGYVMPTPLQGHAIPIAMAGRDLFVCAPTRAGKTAAFCLPIISQVLLTKTQSPDDGDRWTVFPVGLILTPTKESACQICLEAEKLAYGSGVKVAGVYGGVTMAQELRHLERGVDILVATPGILVDLLERSRVSLKRIKYLALDEADRMLDMDFGSYIRNFVQQMDMPLTRQTLIFSGTFSVELVRLALDFLKNYIFLTVGTFELKSNIDFVTQKVEFVRDTDKVQHLCSLLKNHRDNGTHDKPALTLVFVETQKAASQLENCLLENGFPVLAIHGDKVQTAIEKGLRVFHCGTTSILVTTDAASRGSYIPHVAHVINFDLPESIDDYIHRIDLAGPAGKSGLATAFFSEKNKPLAKALVEVLDKANQKVPNWLNDYAEHSLHYGGDQNQRYGSHCYGGYGFNWGHSH